MQSHRKTHAVITGFVIVMCAFMGLILGLLAYVFRQGGESWEFIAIALGIIVLGGVGMLLLIVRKLRQQRTHDEYQKRISSDPRLKEMVTLNPSERRYVKKRLVVMVLVFMVVFGGLGTQVVYEYVHFKDGQSIMAEVKAVRRTGRRNRRYKATVELLVDGATITKEISLSSRPGDEIEVQVVETDSGYDVGIMSPGDELFFMLVWLGIALSVIPTQV